MFPRFFVSHPKLSGVMFDPSFFLESVFSLFSRVFCAECPRDVYTHNTVSLE